MGRYLFKIHNCYKTSLQAARHILAFLHARIFPNFLKSETGATTIEYIGIAVAAIVFISWFDDFWQAAISTAASTISFF